jgi:hypothetical protein
VAAELREIDLALASYPEDAWPVLAGPVLLARLDGPVDIEPDEVHGAVRRAQYLAAASGDPHEGDDPSGPAVAMLADELDTRERRLELADAVRAHPDLARAVAQRLPRVEAVLRSLAAPPGDDPSLTWRLYCATLYALALAEDEDEDEA